MGSVAATDHFSFPVRADCTTCSTTFSRLVVTTAVPLSIVLLLTAIKDAMRFHFIFSLCHFL
jgi:hypothetical protein